MASHKLLLLETSLKSIISYVMGTHRLGGYTNLTDNRLLTTEDDPFSQWILHHSRHIYIFEYLLHDCLSSVVVFVRFQFVVAVCLCYPPSFIVHKYLPSYKTTYLPSAIIIIILICDILWLCVTPLLCIL